MVDGNCHRESKRSTRFCSRPRPGLRLGADPPRPPDPPTPPEALRDLGHPSLGTASIRPSYTQCLRLTNGTIFDRPADAKGARQPFSHAARPSDPARFKPRRPSGERSDVAARRRPYICSPATSLDPASLVRPTATLASIPDPTPSQPGQCDLAADGQPPAMWLRRRHRHSSPRQSRPGTTGLTPYLEPEEPGYRPIRPSADGLPHPPAAGPDSQGDATLRAIPAPKRSAPHSAIEASCPVRAPTSAAREPAASNYRESPSRNVS
jgi:hypothetical protein